MKTAILCAVFLIVGAVAGSLVTGYAAKIILQRQNALMIAGELGNTVMQAEMLRAGEVKIVLNSLENGIPSWVKAVNEPDVRDNTFLADSSLQAAKRFYVCSNTPIPAEISDIMAGTTLPDDACGSTP